MQALAGLSKLRILVVLAAFGVVIGAFLSGPNGFGSQNSLGTEAGLNNGPFTQLRFSGSAVNGAGNYGTYNTQFGNTQFGQTGGGSAQAAGGMSVQGSMPPAGGAGVPVTASPTQPLPAQPDILYPYDPPPYKCQYPTNTMIACPYCGNTNFRYPCGGCGGSGNVQLMCYPLE